MTHRLQKVNSLLLRELNAIVQQRVHDPRLNMVTICGVDVTPDLQIAKVFVSSSGHDEKDRGVMSALHKARPFIQKELASSVILKYLPELHFMIDRTEIEAERIEKLIDGLHKEDDAI
jgi:ribosome-binding factor A